MRGARFRVSWPPVAVSGIGFLAWVAGSRGSDPDVLFPLWRLVTTVALFGTFLFSMAGWGALIRQRALGLKPHLPASLALGVMSFIWIAMALGASGLLGGPARAVFLLVLLLGPILGWEFLQKERKDAASLFEDSAPARVLGGAWLVIFALRVWKALTPWGQSDPLFYQLLGPRLWTTQGSLRFVPHSPFLYESGAWEHLHLWPMHLLSVEPQFGLIESQLFAQLSHVTLGYLATGLALFWFSRSVLRFATLESLVVVTAGLLVRDLLWVSCLAKNDWVSPFLIVTSLSLIFAGKGRDRLLGALFLGFSVAVKFTSGALMVPVLLLFAWQQFARREGFRAFWTVSATAFLGLAPQLLRNYLGTSNPFYPFFGAFFESPQATWGFKQMTQSYGLEGAGGGLGFSIWAYRTFLILIGEGTFGIPLIVLLALGPFVKKRPPWFGLAMAVLTAFFLFSAHPGKFEARHFGPILVLLAALGVATLLFYTPKTTRTAIALAAAGAAILFADVVRTGNYEDPALIKSPFTGPSGNFTAQIREFSGGLAHAWLRMNTGPSDRIVSVGNRHFYYVSHLRISCLGDDPDFGDLYVPPARSPEEWLAHLRKKGVRYFVDVHGITGPSPESLFLNQVLSGFPEAVVFSAPKQRIIDLLKVRGLE